MTILNRMVSRRAVLKGMTSSVLAAALPGLTSSCSPSRDNVEIAARHMVDILNHPKRAREVGKQHIARTPELKNASYHALTENLLTKLGIDPESVPQNALTTLTGKLHRQVRKDFERENVVVIEGFMLSKTEALLCALASIYTK